MCKSRKEILCKVLCLSLLVLFFLPLAATAAPITEPTSLSPGSNYRLAFLTTGAITAASSNIDTYNNFVTSQANAQAELATLGADWFAIGSTSSVDARDNTGTNPSSTGVPIFLLNDTKLADNNADLWNGSIDVALNVLRDGSVSAEVIVWTGTNGIGVASNYLGFATPAHGKSSVTTTGWVFDNFTFNVFNYRMYAVSSELTVSPVPGPTTILLLGSSLIGLAGFREWFIKR